MMTVPLTEFTINQLTKMLAHARLGRTEAKHSLDQMSAMFLQPHEAHRWAERYSECEDYLFIETQLMNAISEVLEKQKQLAS